MKKERLKKLLRFSSFAIITGFILTVIFFFVGPIPLAVRVWEPFVQSELKKYDMVEYTPIILAIINQESGGKKLDIMQSSESVDLPPNTIKNPRASIKTGIYYFTQSINRKNETKVDLDTAIQSYNYGLGYIDYIKQNGGKHTHQLSKQFAKDWAKKMNWLTYGDSEYVYKINDYTKMLSNE